MQGENIINHKETTLYIKCIASTEISSIEIVNVKPKHLKHK